MLFEFKSAECGRKVAGGCQVLYYDDGDPIPVRREEKAMCKNTPTRKKRRRPSRRFH